MIKYFSTILYFSLLNIMFHPLYSQDAHKSYVIIDYTNFIAIADNQEKEIVAQLRAQGGNELFAAYFMVKADKNLSSRLQELRNKDCVIAIVSAHQKFYDMVAKKIFALNDIEIESLDNLGDRDEILKNGIADSDLIATINKNYSDITLITALDDTMKSMYEKLKPQLPGLCVEGYRNALIVAQETTEKQLVAASQKLPNIFNNTESALMSSDGLAAEIKEQE